MNILKCCLNPKVLAGLAVVGVGLYLIAPGAVLGALPLLIGLVCPLSMLLMMRGMGNMGSAQPATTAPAPAPATGAGGTQTAQPPLESTGGVSREAQLGLLRAQLRVLEEERAALAARIAQLQGSGMEPAQPGKAVLAEAERVAQAAATRP